MAQNIDDFNRGAALILAHLYERFPVPAMLKVAELNRHDDLLADDMDRRDARHKIYAATVEFLAQEGYLRYGGKAGNGEIYSGAVLTSKGLAALQEAPEALQPPRQTVGDRLLEASRSPTGEAAKEVIREAIA